MTRGARSSIVAGIVVALALAGPVSGAAASAAGIRQVFARYAGRILVAEGHVVEAIEKYKSTREAAPVTTAIEESRTVLSELRRKIEAQSAPRPKVRRAKHDIVAGLGGIVAGYASLSTAFSEQASDEQAAKAEATAALATVKKAQKELQAGLKLLGK